MKRTVRDRIGQEIDLPSATALWVLSAHLFALSSALPLLIAMHSHSVAFVSPAFITIGVALYTAGVAFECAQNTLDRWYLTHTDPSFLDGLFNTFMIAGFSLIAMGASHAPWLRTLAVVVALAHPVFYVAGHWVRFALLTLALLLVDYALYDALGAPVVFVHTLATFAGLYFLALLMRTGAQSFHGWAALCFGLSMYAFPLAIEQYAREETTPWHVLAIGSACFALLLGALWPWLSRTDATARRHKQSAHDTQVMV